MHVLHFVTLDFDISKFYFLHSYRSVESIFNNLSLF